MIFKSYVLEENLETLKKVKIVLFYGENLGLKKEFKDRLREGNKKIEIINLNQDDIIKNQKIIINEISNKSLFAQEKMIFIEQVTDKILQFIEEIINDVDSEKIFLFADLLDKKSKLRSYLEKSKIFGVVPCYNDSEITIKKIITQKLKDYTGLTPQIINLIIQNSSLERNKVLNEIEKIKTFFIDKKINEKYIEELLNIKTNENLNNLRDEAIKGNKINTNKLLSETVIETENHIYFINSINQRINKINEIDKSKEKGNNVEAIIASLKPPVFWKDKPTLIEQTKKWNKKKIQEILKKTYKAEIEIKSKQSIRKDLLIKNLLIEICSTANSP